MAVKKYKKIIRNITQETRNKMKVMDDLFVNSKNKLKSIEDRMAEKEIAEYVSDLKSDDANKVYKAVCY